MEGPGRPWAATAEAADVEADGLERLPVLAAFARARGRGPSSAERFLDFRGAIALFYLSWLFL